MNIRTQKAYSQNNLGHLIDSLFCDIVLDVWVIDVYRQTLGYGMTRLCNDCSSTPLCNKQSILCDVPAK